MVVAATTHRFTVADYHRMAEAGIFHDDDRVELLAGEILDVPRPSRREQSCVDRLAALLMRAIAREAIVRVRGPIRLSHESGRSPT